MKYLTIFVMSMTILFVTGCASSGIEPTAEPEAVETIPALPTAVSTEAPAPTDESYPAPEPTPESMEESYPAAPAPVATTNPYPDQDAETPPDATNPTDDTSPSQSVDSATITELVSEDLALRSDTDVSKITVVSSETVEWSDSSLGCPAPDYAYAQVITPGYQIILNADGTQYDYHTDMKGNFVLCDKDGNPVR